MMGANGNVQNAIPMNHSAQIKQVVQKENGDCVHASWRSERFAWEGRTQHLRF
jgi:hypothetical protein